jgi:hypothetical protein
LSPHYHSVRLWTGTGTTGSTEACDKQTEVNGGSEWGLWDFANSRIGV